MVVPDKFKTWQVYIYDPRDVNSRLHCPKCMGFPRSLGAFGMFPPFACVKDKIFFDATDDVELLKRSVNVAWMYRRGDLGQFFNRHGGLKPLRTDKPQPR